MKLHNIHSIRKKAYKITTNSKHSYAVSPNLLQRNFIADKPNQKWVGDITYIRTDEGWLYAAIVKDLCLKKIVGYAFSDHIDTNLTVTALEMAVNRQKPHAAFPELMDRKKCNIMEWTQTNPKSRRNFHVNQKRNNTTSL